MNEEDDEVKEIRQDVYIGMNMRNSKLITTASLRSKLNSVLVLAVDTIKDAVSSEDKKLAYKAALDVLNFHISLARLEMQEENHREELRFKRYKNRMNRRAEEHLKIQDDINVGGGTTSIPQSEFSEDFDNWGFS